jgi:hypothetical protein
MNKRIENLINSLPNGIPPGCIINSVGFIQRIRITKDMNKTDRFVKTIEHVVNHRIERSGGDYGYALNILQKKSVGHGVVDPYNNVSLCICGHVIHNIYVLYTINEPVNYGFIVGSDCVELHIGNKKNMKEKKLLIDIYIPENVFYILKMQMFYKNKYESRILCILRKYERKYREQLRRRFNRLKLQCLKISTKLKINMIKKWAKSNPQFDTKFILSIENQVNRNVTLSEKQENSINNIIQKNKITI